MQMNELFFVFFNFIGISHRRDLGSINHKTDSKQLINLKVAIRNLVKKMAETFQFIVKHKM